MSFDHLIGSSSGRVGDVLARELRRGEWTRLTAIVAFARMSGVRHVEARLRAFVSSGGRVDLTVGVDMSGTTYEAAWYLMNAVAARGRLLLASAEPGATFHPKVFVFSDASPTDRNPAHALRVASRALVVIGSSNLTGGGLYVNDEASLVWRPTLARADDAAAWTSLVDALSDWITPKGTTILGSATASRLTSMALAGRLRRELALAGTRPPGVRRRLGSPSGVARRPPPRAPKLLGPPPPAPGPPAVKSPPGLSVLIARLSFGKSRRWEQWELNSDILREFFGISTRGTPVPREGVTRSSVRLSVLRKPLVIGVGRNRRLEFPEPDGRPDPSPARALLVVVDRRPQPFRYAVLLPGDAEYRAVDALNLSSTPIGQYVEGTRRVIVPYATPTAVWPGCPL
jgi:HKD family nuclease